MPPHITARQWLSDLCTRFADDDALIERGTGRSLRYAELWTAISCEMQFIREMAGATACTWIVEERPDHAIVAYLASLALGRRVCFATKASFESAFATLTGPDDAPALLYCPDGTGLPRTGPVPTVRHTTAPWDLAPGDPTPPSEEAAEPAGAGEVVFFSSGTTGRSKAIVIPWSSLLRNADDLAEAFTFSRERHLLVLPLSHTNGQVLGLLAPMARGGTVVLGATTGIAALFRLWRDIAALQINVVDCVPTAIQSVLTMRQFPAAGDRRPRLFISGGAPISQVTIAAFEARYDVELLQEYGLSEAVCVSACERPDVRKHGSVGKALPGTEIRIRRTDGSDADPGERGRVHIRTPSLMSHYERCGDMIAPPLQAGFLVTNDIGLIDDEGFLFIFGRVDDTLIKGGFNILPADVEERLAFYPGLADCAVLGVACETYGEDLVVFYVQGPGPAVAATKLKAYLRDHGDRMWYPRAVIRVDSLPVTSSGKVLRRALHDLLPSPDDAEHAGRRASQQAEGR